MYFKSEFYVVYFLNLEALFHSKNIRIKVKVSGQLSECCQLQKHLGLKRLQSLPSDDFTVLPKIKRYFILATKKLTL